MSIILSTVVGILVVLMIFLVLAVRIIKQYEQGVLFRLGRVLGLRAPGFRVIIPFVDVMHRVSMRIVTMPIQSQGIITRDDVSVDVSAAAYYRVIDAVKSVVAIENVQVAINQIAQTTLRKVVGQHTLQSLVEIGVDKNTTVVFPAPLMSTIGELGSFLARETAAASAPTPPVPNRAAGASAHIPTSNGTSAAPTGV
jgi:hypothetical protein